MRLPCYLAGLSRKRLFRGDWEDWVSSLRARPGAGPQTNRRLNGRWHGGRPFPAFKNSAFSSRKMRRPFCRRFLSRSKRSAGLHGTTKRCLTRLRRCRRVSICATTHGRTAPFLTRNLPGRLRNAMRAIPPIIRMRTGMPTGLRLKFLPRGRRRSSANCSKKTQRWARRRLPAIRSFSCCKKT